MTSGRILGTPFLTQIYPFYVNEIGLHTKIMGKTIYFKFLTAAKQKEIAQLQSSSIYQQINTITGLHEKVKSLQHIIQHVKSFPCLGIRHPHAFIFIKTNIGIRKEKGGPKKEQMDHFYSESWHSSQQNHSTNKKEILAIVFIIFKIQDNLFIKRFFLQVYCTSVKEILQRNMQNVVSKHIVARWQAILATSILKSNSSKDFITLSLIF